MGPLVANRYELLNEIGRGGHGVVCRARDVTNGRFVAVKMLNDAASREPEYEERLAREKAAMLALAGTNAVELLDLCRSATGALCLVMELLDGKTLEARFEELAERGEPMPVDELAALLGPVVSTLERAHAAGIIHRDIKPANVFLTREGDVRLLDFGLARLKDAAPLTAVGTVMGSPSCIAPEVWKGQPHLIDHRADVYSLGVIVFRALSGRLPFGGATLLDKLQEVTTAPRPSLHLLRADLDPRIDAWVQRALAIEPSDRFNSAKELRASLIGLLRPGSEIADATAKPDALAPVSHAPFNVHALLEATRPHVIAAWRQARSWAARCASAVAGAMNALAAKRAARGRSTRPPAGHYTATHTLIVQPEELPVPSQADQTITPSEGQQQDAQTLLFIRKGEAQPELPTLMHMPYDEVAAPLGPVDALPRAETDQSFVADYLSGSDLRPAEAARPSPVPPPMAFPHLPPPPPPLPGTPPPERDPSDESSGLEASAARAKERARQGTSRSQGGKKQSNSKPRASKRRKTK
jgi:serine/threonine-protein kinase